MADAFADLVGAIGDAAFPDCFHAALSNLAPVALCSAFRQSDHGSLSLLFARGVVPSVTDFPVCASLDYARTYWRFDTQLRQLSRTLRNRPIVVRKAASEIADPAYRAACYERAGIRERVSIHLPGLIANGYRMTDAASFSASEIDRIEGHAGLLMAALDRHDRLRAPVQDEAGLAQSLMALHYGLSIREAEVSAAMMLGETQSEIAARKQLSPYSVVTYRRRAYGKLGIANRRDLMRLHRRLAGGANA